MGLFETTEEELYQIAISRPLEEKIDQAISLIQATEGQALKLSDDGFYVCFSGGKDSIVMARLFEMAGVKFGLHYNNVTIDPPELVRFIKEEYPHAEWHSVGKHLINYMAEDKVCGPPTRLIRWCCEIYKEQGGVDKFRAIGVRAEESARRKGLWKQITTDRKTKMPILCPILYWTHADIWAFIKQHDMPYCCLYDEGFDRLGCVGCPMGGPKGQARDFARWPKYEAMWKRGFRKYFDKYKGVPKRNGEPRAIEKFPTVDDLWNWWISGKAYEGDNPDCQLWLW
ncbi:MAG: phosphoadenosine phosphosulfate reductase family protein [Pedobacter sp.]